MCIHAAILRMLRYLYSYDLLLVVRFIRFNFFPIVFDLTTFVFFLYLFFLFNYVLPMAGKVVPIINFVRQLTRASYGVRLNFGFLEVPFRILVTDAFCNSIAWQTCLVDLCTLFCFDFRTIRCRNMLLFLLIGRRFGSDNFGKFRIVVLLVRVQCRFLPIGEGDMVVCVISMCSIRFSVLKGRHLCLSYRVLCVVNSYPYRKVESILLPLLLCSMKRVSSFQMLPYSVSDH